MKSKIFKPLKAPNKMLKIQELPYPLLASYKIDGIRGLITNDKVLSCSLKNIPSKYIQDKFKILTKIEKDVYLEGEFYNPNISFHLIQSCIMTQDCTTSIAKKKWEKLCLEQNVTISRDEAMTGIKLYVFDRVHLNYLDEPFKNRTNYVKNCIEYAPDLLEYVKQIMVTSPEETEKYYHEALDWGCDGLILRDAMGRYKCGRATLNEALIFKLKPYITFDAKIIDVIQATKVDPNAEKKINELGRSVTSKKKGDRILIEKACDFLVKHQGEDNLKVVIAKSDIEKEKIWGNKEKYIGKWIEYKGLMVGAKDLPRHPVFLRYRFDK